MRERQQSDIESEQQFLISMRSLVKIINNIRPVTSCLFILSVPPIPAFAQDEVSLITNIKVYRELKGGIQEMPFKENIYDLSFTAYDADFANEFGLMDKNITELDAGLRFIELRMITEGAQTNCYYNVVLDKSLKLDFPEEDFELGIHQRALLQKHSSLII